jgi:hypothetical protein
MTCCDFLPTHPLLTVQDYSVDPDAWSAQPTAEDLQPQVRHLQQVLCFLQPPKAAIRRSRRQECADPDFSVQAASVASKQWHLDGAACAWHHTQGERVVVAVMDTGCDFTHLDLAPNAWVNTAEIPNNGIDDDGNGFVDGMRPSLNAQYFRSVLPHMRSCGS